VIARESRAPGAQQRRLAQYLDSLAQAAGHADRIVPFKAYCTGLLLPGERKSIEPMAARLDPDHVGRTHQCLHHLVADAPWDNEVLLDKVLGYGASGHAAGGPDRSLGGGDTGFPKQGQHSVGVTRQYRGQVGKQDNCRVAVSLSVTTENVSMPIAFRLYLPEVWANDKPRREKACVPDDVVFQTKPRIALDQIQRARERGLPTGIVLADAGYGNDTQFRTQLTEWKLPYIAGVQSAVSVWEPGREPKPAPERSHGFSSDKSWKTAMSQSSDDPALRQQNA
jgi:SRSO17 transposase